MIRSKICPNENVYDCSNPKSGVALIFNQKFFKEKPSRAGTDKDATDLGEVLADIGFDVKICNDYSVGEIKREIYELSERDHSENDCLFVCIMTHGRENGTIFAFDDEFATADLWENFTEENCSSLIGKPKLFFIQACRGSMTDHGVVESIIHESKTEKKLLRQGLLMQKFEQSRTQVSLDLFSMTDIFKMHSTAEGHYSFRNKNEGTWFIQALCEELRENIHEDLMTIGTNINRRVAYSKQSNVPDDKKLDASKQMPCVDSHLTKKFYFVKKTLKAKVQVV